jgi:hypothetical protein
MRRGFCWQCREHLNDGGKLQVVARIGAVETLNVTGGERVAPVLAFDREARADLNALDGERSRDDCEPLSLHGANYGVQPLVRQETAN